MRESADGGALSSESRSATSLTIAANVPSYTSAEAAKRLGVTITMVKNLAKEGRLEYFKREDRYLFPCAALLAFARTYKPIEQKQAASKREVVRARGHAAASVFACFARGLDLRKTVIETGYAPETIRGLWREWKTPLDAGEKQRRAIEIAKVEAAEEKRAAKERAARERKELRDAKLAMQRKAEAPREPELSPWRQKLRGNGEVIPFARKGCEEAKR